MKVTKITNDFAPRNRAICFGIETELDEPCNVEVEVVNVEANTTLARQIIREVTSATVNIAPYTKPFAEYTPSLHHETSFEEAPTASYTIRVDDIDAEPIRLTVNCEEQSLPSLVSTMPTKRTIAYGERDELLLLANAGDTFATIIKTDTGEELSLDYTTQTGAAILSLSTEDFGSDVRTLEVTILCNDSHLNVLHYNVVASRKGAIRLAWISSKGSIERYTFPAVTKSQRKSEKESHTTLAGRRVTSSNTESSLTLVSRYEPRSTIKALADIISTTKVWIEGEDVCHEVEVRSSTVDTNLFGEPDSTVIELTEWRREEVAL